LNGLNLTPGFNLSSSEEFDKAAYRAVGAPEVIRCFSCHSTGSTINGRFDASHLMLGVSCEACHGPGKQHVEVMKAVTAKGKSFGGKSYIFNPANLKPAYTQDFCGSCHGAYWDVALMPIEEGLETTRFQPYRLQESKCWEKDGDARLTCTSCHDPHQSLDTNLESYDRICLSCHRVGDKPNGINGHVGPVCRISTKECCSCHMPKNNFPGMHRSFHDHKIQIMESRPS
jgi:predicted CXXCH cytochrome family protein